MKPPLRPLLAALTTTAALCAFTLIGPAGAASAKTSTCSPFTQPASGTSYHWFDIRASHVSCKTAERVLHGFFGGAGKPAGSSPVDGYWVYGWRCRTGPAVPSGRTPASCSHGTARINADWH